MPEHATPKEPALPAAEPASVSEIARLIVAALVALGVFNFDDATVNTITLIVGGLISIGLTYWTRCKSTPIAKPRSKDGASLIPLARAAELQRPGS